MEKNELFKILYDKDTKENYKKFLQILENADVSNELYDYYDDIECMLTNEKSYIRVRGFMLICNLCKWDLLNKICANIDNILRILDDEKPIVVRMALSKIHLLINKEELKEKIIRKLKNIDCNKYKDSMSPLIKKDIEKILEEIKKNA